ncbi:helix-turn-helix domain-containing protein [Paenibacillus sp. OSY-SE]|nr:helix-turn-helix domain-containing protein [Paenibacillus sp. OSY-SE]
MILSKLQEAVGVDKGSLSRIENGESSVRILTSFNP